MSYQKFTLEFKDEATRQVTKRSYSIAQVSERLRLSFHSHAELIQIAVRLDTRP